MLALGVVVVVGAKKVQHQRRSKLFLRIKCKLSKHTKPVVVEAVTVTLDCSGSYAPWRWEARRSSIFEHHRLPSTTFTLPDSFIKQQFQRARSILLHPQTPSKSHLRVA